MDLYLHFIMVNSDFSKGYADDIHNGEESEDNIKYLWEDEFKVSNRVKDFKIKNKNIYNLIGLMADDMPFNHEIWDVTTVDCVTTTGEEMQFAISKKLIKKTDVFRDDKKGETRLYFYLKDSVPFENPMNGVYIAKTDFPKELKKKKNE